LIFSLKGFAPLLKGQLDRLAQGLDLDTSYAVLE
jgi:hypothetical protein